MAENEYLNAARSGRWQSVVDGILLDRQPVELAEAALSCFISKEIGSLYDNLNFGELIASAEDLDELERKCGESDDGEIPKDFLIEASRRGGGLITILERFLTDAFRNCAADIPHLAAMRDPTVSISGTKAKVAAIDSIMLPAIQKLAVLMAANPRRKPRRDRRLLGVAPRLPSSQSTEGMLSESLLKRK